MTVREEIPARGAGYRDAPARQRQRGLPLRHPPARRQRDGIFRRVTLFRHCEPTGHANACPMTGSAKQSIQQTRRLDCFVATLLAMTAIGPRSAVYSITAWSGASDCLRSAALVEPIMIAKGIAQSVKIITIW